MLVHRLGLALAFGHEISRPRICQKRKDLEKFLNNEMIEIVLKYFGVHLISGKNFKIDLTSAKLKYYGCFNGILSVIGKQQNEIACLNLVSTYYLPKLTYGCEIMSNEHS